MFDDNQKVLTAAQKFFMWGFGMAESDLSIEEFNKEPLYDDEKEYYYRINSIQRMPESGYQNRLVFKDGLIEDGFAIFNALNGNFVEMHTKVSKNTYREAIATAKSLVDEMNSMGSINEKTGFTLVDTKVGFFDSEKTFTNKVSGVQIVFIHISLRGYAIIFRHRKRSYSF